MNPWRSLKGLPRALYIAALATFVNRAGTMVLPFLALFLARERGLGDERAGHVLALFGGATLVTAPIAGRLCDRLGARRMMILSLVAGAGAFAVYPLARSLWAILGVTALIAATSEAFRPASLAFVTDVAGAEQRKAAFALQRLAVNLGMSIGPVAGGFLAERWFEGIFVVDAATSIGAAVVLMFTAQASGVGPQASGRAGASLAVASSLKPEASVRPGHRDPAMLRLCAAMLLVGLVFLQLDSSMPLYLTGELGFSKSTYGSVFVINTGLIILVEVPLNAAMSRWPARRATALGAFLVAVGFASTGLAHDLPTFLPTVVVWTFGEMILFPASSAFVADIAPTGKSGEYMGLFSMSFGLAATIAPWIGTTVLHRFGGGTLWLGALVLGLGAVAIVATLAPRRSPAER